MRVRCAMQLCFLPCSHLTSESYAVHVRWAADRQRQPADAGVGSTTRQAFDAQAGWFVVQARVQIPDVVATELDLVSIVSAADQIKYGSPVTRVAPPGLVRSGQTHINLHKSVGSI